MTPSVAVLSANFGGYDNPWPLSPQDIGCDAILVSDRPVEVAGWRTVLVERNGLPPRLAAKQPRCRPDRYTDADIVVWLDAHLEVRSGSFVRELVEGLGDRQLGVFRHGYHTSIIQEGALASTLPKYAGWDLLAQVAHYLQQGHPDDWGMWTTGVMVRRPAATVVFGDAWQAEIDRWGPEDQISLPYVLRRTIGRPVDLPFEGWWDGRRFMLHRHNDGTG